ncbi:MAG TPA: hypothetical protein VFC63_00705, partial [Blastocatellia bacterium]|nr:hypothetical protein [Blastocatellia bacterium]
LTNGIAVSGGYDHSTALLANGRVVACGGNWANQIDSSGNQYSTFVPVAGLSNIVTTVSGLFHNLSLDANGNLYVWGNHGLSINSAPTLIAGVSNVTAIAAGSDNSIISTRDGKLYTFGDTLAPIDLYTNYSTDGSGMPDWWEIQYFGHIGVNPTNDADGDGWNNLYEYQHGMNPTNFNTPPTPTVASVTQNTNNFNITITWNAATVQPLHYIIERSDYSADTFSYGSLQDVGEVDGDVTTFEDDGTVPGDDANSIYEVQAVYPGGSSPLSDEAYVGGSAPAALNYNLPVTASLTRNSTGRWQLMFSGNIPDSVQFIRIYCATSSIDGYYGYDFLGISSSEDISLSSITNGIYQFSDYETANLLGDGIFVAGIASNAPPGTATFAGIIASDAPYFVDGRRQMKQNLNFLLQAASLDRTWGNMETVPNGFYFLNQLGYYDGNASRYNQSDRTFEEFSFIDWQIGMDNLWPFDANYDLHNWAVDTTRTNNYPIGFDGLNYTVDFGNPNPASAQLNSDPQWIIQPGFRDDGNTNYISAVNWGVFLQNTNKMATLTSGLNNLYGLPYQSGCAIDWAGWSCNGHYQFFYAGSSVTAPSGYTIGDYNGSLGYASQTPAASLQLVNYYFAPIMNPYNNSMDIGSGGIYTGINGVWQSIGGRPSQPYSFPLQTDFNVTNQTPAMFASVGQSIIIGAWAKYSIQNGDPNKFAYLGQYFRTNAFKVDNNGNVTSTNTGVVSPYG